VFSHVIEFARRMALNDVLTPEALVSISLWNIAGLNLFVPKQFPSRFCKSNKIEVTEEVAFSDLGGRSSEIVIDLTLRCFAEFGWTDPDRAKLEQEQRRFTL
jgi:hypothetical protein